MAKEIPPLTLVSLLVAGALVTLPIPALGRDGPGWPRFRGPGGSGVAPDDADFPVDFGPDGNLAWKVALPGGHSSPCIFGDRIFLTGFSDGELQTLCLRRRDGEILWQRSVSPETIEPGSRRSSPAASTPATDGERVYVYFGSFGLVAYDPQGREQWRRPLPTPITQHGASTSPVVSDGRLFLACDQDVGSHLMAVDCRNGKTLWKTERPGFRRGFSTPILWPPEKPSELVLTGTLSLAAYDLRTGTERWRVRGLPNEMVSSPVAGDGLIFAAGWTYGSGVERMPLFDDLLKAGDGDGDGLLTRDEAPAGPAKQHFTYIDADKNGRLSRREWDSMSQIFEKSENALLAVRPGEPGDLTGTNVVWKKDRGLPYVPSPLFYRGRIFIVKNGGIASCFDARTGDAHYVQKRIGALGDYYSSPVAAGGKICIASERGVVVVIEAGDSLEVLARNELGEPILATPAIVEDTLYVRSEKHLWAFRSRRP